MATEISIPGPKFPVNTDPICDVIKTLNVNISGTENAIEVIDTFLEFSNRDG